MCGGMATLLGVRDAFGVFKTALAAESNQRVVRSRLILNTKL
jgi:hypothetical protein